MIKRDYVVEIIEKLVSSGQFTPENMMMSVNALPDAVVRCRECKHWVEDIGWCNLYSHILASGEWTMFDPDYYCADGERSEGE